MASLICLPCAAYSAAEKTAPKKGFHVLSAEDISGKMTPFSSFASNVLLIVNTASQCGYTSQYKGLEALYQKYKSSGLVVMGFPSNDFGRQEPGSGRQIADFCQVNYGVSFPMFDKSSVSGSPGDGPTNPFYQRLAAATKSRPQWNFHKYLLGKDGALLETFGSRVAPSAPEVTKAVEVALG